jgi:hypothetical protein
VLLVTWDKPSQVDSVTSDGIDPDALVEDIT